MKIQICASIVFLLSSLLWGAMSEPIYEDTAGFDGRFAQALDANHPISSLSNGLFNLFMLPVRATLNTARRLISVGSDQLDQGIDTMRLQTYRMFMQLYNKTYSASELPQRMAVYFSRRAAIQESGRQYLAGRAPFAMRENEFTDWSDEELNKLRGVFSAGEADFRPGAEMAADVKGLQVSGEVLPDSKDWRATGCVAAPFYQRDCGSCYAVTTVSLVETMRCLKTGSLQQLSVQQIVDCATIRQGYLNLGCSGGHEHSVLEYLKKSSLISLASCYPYTARDNTCRLTEMSRRPGCTRLASASSSPFGWKTLHGESAILEHVAKVGPVVTDMKVTTGFQFYGSGIFDDPTCTRATYGMDHSVIIVGYGSQNGRDYWIVKNSWGSGWGENGYVRFKRGTNACSIAYRGWVITS